MDNEAIIKSINEYEAFLDSLTEPERALAVKYSEETSAIELIASVVREDEIRFDQIVSTLLPKEKFKDDIVIMICDFYIKRSLHDIAFTFITHAEAYYVQNGLVFPARIESKKNDLRDDKLFEKIRITLNEIRNLPPSDIPRIGPRFRNGVDSIQGFVLEEILSGLRLITKKIRAIESIRGEDKYSDVLQATLDLRLQIWGWTIGDQNRGGAPLGVNGPGRIDLTIKGKNDLTLIEAFILKGKNKAEVTKHVLKCKDYLPNLEYYFILIYYKGRKANFSKTWSSYSKDVLNIRYPAEMKLDKRQSFVDITDKSTEVANFKIAFTKHGDKTVLYHIMVDLSSRPRK